MRAVPRRRLPESAHLPLPRRWLRVHRRIGSLFPWGLWLLLIGSVTAQESQVIVLGLFKDKAVLSIDGARRVLCVGETSPDGVRLISANSREAIVELDGELRTLGLTGRAGGPYAARERAEVAIWRDSTGMFRTVGSINGLTVSFLVDTGATTLAINAAEARRLGIDYRFVGRKGVVQTAAGNVPAYHLNLDLVRVGDIIQRQVPAVVIEGDSPDHVLLGMSFLGRLEMENTGQALHLREKFR